MLALVGFKLNDQAFGAAADGAGEMEMGRRHVATGKDEGTQGGEVMIEVINLAFQAIHLLWQYAQRFVGQFLACLGHAEISAEIKKFVLNAGEHGIELGEGFGVGMEPDNSQNRIGFINGAIGLNAEMGLGNAGARAQGRVALVAGAGIDAVEYDHASE